MFYVGLGGALGAMLRYALSFVPIKSDFPVITLLTNLAGAFFIGITVGSVTKGKISKELELFLKTGLCGGFTTFSTFSLETFKLIESGKYLIAGTYMLLSVLLCLVGVFAGLRLSRQGFDI